MKAKWLVASSIFTVLVIYVAFLLVHAGAFQKIQNMSFGICQSSQKILGPEDMVQVSPDVVLISSDSRLPQDENTNGDIDIYTLSDRHVTPTHIAEKLSFRFHPHGVHALLTPQGAELYVINHRSEEDTSVEVFTWTKTGGLQFSHSLESDKFQAGNDLFVVGNDQFYITSDFGTTKKWLQKIQQYSQYGSGYLSYHDTQSTNIIMPSIFYANGVAGTEDGRFLFVASMIAKEILIYDTSLKPLHLIKTIQVPIAPDNIIYFQGDLYIAGHPNLIALKKMSEDRKERAPSEVLVLHGWQNDNYELQTLYENDGRELSASSVALPITPERILIGSVFDNHILDCAKSH